MPDLSNLDIISTYCDDGTTMRTWKSYRIGNSSTKLNTTNQHNYLLRIKFTLSQPISSLSFNLGPCYWYPYEEDNSRKLTYSGNTVYHISTGGTKHTLYQPGYSQNCFGYAITTSSTALGYISGLNSGDSNPTTAINNALSATAAGTKARGDIVITAAANESSRWANLTGTCNVSLPAGTYYLWCFATNYNMNSIFRFFCASGFYYNKTPTISVINETYTVSYNANGGNANSIPASQTKEYNQTLTLSNVSPTRNGSTETFTITYNINGGLSTPAPNNSTKTTTYSFSTWNTKNNNTGTSYMPSAAYIDNKSVTLYAIWTSFSTTQSISLPVVTRPGYTFKGWSESNSATTGITGTYAPNRNITLYAIWEPAAIIHTKVNNQWVSGLPYIKINNVWKQALATYIKVNGEWKLNK